MSGLTLSTPTAEIIILLVLLGGKLIAVAFGFFDMFKILCERYVA